LSKGGSGVLMVSDSPAETLREWLQAIGPIERLLPNPNPEMQQFWQILALRLTVVLLLFSVE
jgi:hypothetical protein